MTRTYFVRVPALYANKDIAHPFDPIPACVDFGLWSATKEEALEELEEGEEIVEVRVELVEAMDHGQES
jgi:hypothetical protein